MKFLILLIALSPITCEFIDPIQNAETFSSATVGAHPCKEDSKEFESNPRGCSWFWMCRDSSQALLDQPVEGMCPDDLHFHFVNQSCVYDIYSDCKYDDNNFRDTPTTCTDWQMNLIPHVLDCAKYYLCWQNYTIPMECPEGLEFSYFQNNCTTQNLANCRAEHNYCLRMRADGVKLKRSPYSCENYHACYECNNRYKTLEFQCASGSHQFDDVNQQCENATAVECEIEDPAPPSELPVGPFSVVCSPEDIRREHIAHPNDCRQYFNCASGRSRLYTCTKGSHFDPEKNQCWDDENDPMFCERNFPTEATTTS